MSDDEPAAEVRESARGIIDALERALLARGASLEELEQLGEAHRAQGALEEREPVGAGARAAVGGVDDGSRRGALGCRACRAPVAAAVADDHRGGATVNRAVLERRLHAIAAEVAALQPKAPADLSKNPVRW